ncbi:MAG: hypothetical protein DMG30_26820 [Acidobacteria bacterium]|nr:MAG: hypothetical protein DMG30_26820 [Acidobacteriota bacterium]
MTYTDAADLVAEWLILHQCAPGCKCHELRQIPVIAEALARMGTPPWMPPADNRSYRISCY